MSDPLKLLREYLVANKYIGEIEIVDDDTKKRIDVICFGAIAFPRDVPTNFEIWNRKGEFYTLETLLFFAKNKELAHPAYVREASKFRAAKLQASSIFSCNLPV